MLAGGKVTGGTLFASTDPEVYCAMANAGYDFIWTEHQHDARDWKTTARMWASCPYAKAVPGVREAVVVVRAVAGRGATPPARGRGHRRQDQHSEDAPYDRLQQARRPRDRLG